MPTLEKRKWYIASLTLIVVAIAVQFLANHHAGRGMTTMARATAVPAERSRLRQVAFWHAKQSGRCERFSVGFAVFAAGSWLVSRLRGELGPRGLLLALHCIYVLVLFITG